MERWQRWLAGAIGVGAWVVLIADRLDKAKSVIEAPSTVAKFWGYVRNVFDFTPGATFYLLLFGAVCLAVALWRPAYTQFVLSRLPASWPFKNGPSTERGRAMGNGDKNIHIGGDNYGNINQGIIVGPIAPELRAHGRKTTNNGDGTHTTTVTLEVLSPYVTTQKLQIFGEGHGIKSMDVSPIREAPGMYEFSFSRAERDDGRMFLIDAPHGKYAVTLVADAAAFIHLAARMK